MTSLRVLVVEDHPELAAMVGDYLAGRGHVVDFAADGLDGLRRASTQDFDVIVLDRMLPRLDGATLCRRLREESGRSTPVLMLTAMDTVDDRVEGLASGADDYLVKPFALAELEARLLALQRRASGGVGRTRLVVADLEYRTDTARATRSGQPLALNPTTRKLLEHLMRNSDRVVPRAELEHLLWGDELPDGDVLRAHMHNLREAVDRQFPVRLVQTVRGIGYRLAPPA